MCFLEDDKNQKIFHLEIIRVLNERNELKLLSGNWRTCLQYVLKLELGNM
jgi:hypothetical protein